MAELLNCPFCGNAPKTEQYTTFIRIYCPHCETLNRKVDVFGDGHYSAWVRQQTPDANGMVRISADLNPVSDPEAYRNLVAVWNQRPG